MPGEKLSPVEPLSLEGRRGRQVHESMHAVLTHFGLSLDNSEQVHYIHKKPNIPPMKVLYRVVVLNGYSYSLIYKEQAPGYGVLTDRVTTASLTLRKFDQSQKDAWSKLESDVRLYSEFTASKEEKRSYHTGSAWFTDLEDEVELNPANLNEDISNRFQEVYPQQEEQVA